MNKLKNFAYAGMIALSNPNLPVTGPGVNLSEIQQRITEVAQFLIVVSMVIAVIFIIYGGIRYMVAQGDPTAAKAARGTIFHGVIGAAVVLAVGVILQTVAGLVSRTFFS